MLEHVRIVLVNTSHPGNIGATARAMKNMGLRHLVLVNPAEFPHADATARASGADDLLANAVVCDTIEEGIADCELVIATGARSRSLPWPMLTPKQAAEMSTKHSEQKVAFVFGNERIGLTNEQFSLAQYHVQIPTVPSFSSLNLAAAVQVIAYELFAYESTTPVLQAEQEMRELITAEQMAGLMQHLTDVMTAVGFLDPSHPKLLQKRLQRMFHRASLDVTELNIMRGILSAVQSKL